jgi:hypothetical protein
MRGEGRVRGVARSQGISSLLGNSCGGSGCLRLFSSAVIVSIAATVFAQQDFSTVEIKAIHVANNIDILQGAGGNISVSFTRAGKAG